MAAHFGDIQKSLETKLSTVPGIPAIAWENVSFDPVGEEPHVISQVLFEGRKPANRGLTPQQRYDGTYKLEVRYPEGTGPSLASDMADVILTEFEATTDINTFGVVVRISESYRTQGFNEGPWYVVPISIIWYAYKT